MKMLNILLTMPAVLPLQNIDNRPDQIKIPVDNSYFITLI